MERAEDLIPRGKVGGPNRELETAEAWCEVADECSDVSFAREVVQPEELQVLKAGYA